MLPAGGSNPDHATTLDAARITATLVAETWVVDRVHFFLGKAAWRARAIRTGELVECGSFLELLTATLLRGFGEDPKRVEALLKDDAEALRMLRAGVRPAKHKVPKGR